MSGDAAFAQAQRFLNSIPPYSGEDVSGWTGGSFIVARGPYLQIQWMAIAGGIMCFIMAHTIGANDIANAWANTVGSKTLTLWQAMMLGAIFEFAGAVILGGTTGKSVVGGITSPAYFQQVPEVFAFGMLCSLTSAAVVVHLSTYCSLPVSTTHSVIGAIIGFGLVWGGSGVIVWYNTTPKFPYVSGVVTVFLSWFISPLMCASFSAIIFVSNRFVILRRQNAHEWAYWSFPILAAITVFINLFFVLQKGAAKELAWDPNGSHSAWVAAIGASGTALCSIPGVIYLRRRLQQRMVQEEHELSQDLEEYSLDKNELALVARSSLDMTPLPAAKKKPRSCGVRVFHCVKRWFLRGVMVDIHQDAQRNEVVASIHANAEVFDPRAEEVYKYLQVFCACCVSFTHGAVDSGNAISPFAGIWYAYQNSNISSNVYTPRWMLVIGGAGLAAGAWSYGYNIIRVLGIQMARMTPSRGFAAELATSLTISLATIYGLPVSTTQTIVGGDLGVGLAENLSGAGVNAALFLRIALGWVASFLSSTLLCAAVFALCIFSPSANDLNYVENWQSAMSNTMLAQLTMLNNSVAYSPRTYPTLAANMSGLLKNLSSMNTFSKFGKTNQYDFMAVLKNVTWLYINTTKPEYGL